MEDLLKLRLAPSWEPDYESTYLGMLLLAVMPVSARTQVAWDKERKDQAAASVVTLSDVKLSKKGPPLPP